MKLSFNLTIALAALFAALMLSASAAPMFSRPRPDVVEKQQNVAPWWQNYIITDSFKQPPPLPQVVGAKDEELAFHFKPFQQRIAHLEALKNWALSNQETRKALTTDQIRALERPFYGWDEKSIRSYQMDRVSLHTSLGAENDYVAEVESVLYDLAKHLPDLSPRP